MNTYKAVVQYKGTRYFGWQKQPDQITVQGEIEKVLKKITNSNDVFTIGSGRTDAGVHAFGQCLKIKITKFFEAKALLRALNSLLDNDIRFKSLEECSDDFQPVFSAKMKTYEYHFSTDFSAPPFFNDLITYLGKDLDVDLMNDACRLLIGTHDFQNFFTTGTPVKSTVREIFECSVELVSRWDHQGCPCEYYRFKITGNGFLKQMVRLLVAAVWSVGEQKTSLEELRKSLSHKLSNKLAPTAPPHGLYLKEVFY